MTTYSHEIVDFILACVYLSETRMTKCHTRMDFLHRNSHASVSYSHGIYEIPYSHEWESQTRLDFFSHTRMNQRIHTRIDVLQKKLAWKSITYSHESYFHTRMSSFTQKLACIFSHTRLFSKKKVRNSRKNVKTWKISYLKPLCDPSSKSIKSHIK